MKKGRENIPFYKLKSHFLGRNIFKIYLRHHSALFRAFPLEKLLIDLLVNSFPHFRGSSVCSGQLLDFSWGRITGKMVRN